MKKPTKETQEQFPGYPHYPAGEDITNLHNGTHKTNIDPDQGTPKQNTRVPESATEPLSGEDVTAEDKDMLSAFVPEQGYGRYGCRGVCTGYYGRRRGSAQ